MTYAEKLKHPKWQKRRLEIINRDKWQCTQCGEKDKTLHVHHAWYEPRKMPWDYPDEALSTLCEQCHGSAEKQRIRLLRAVAACHTTADLAVGLSRYQTDEIGETQDATLKDLESFEQVWGYMLGFALQATYRAADNAIRTGQLPSPPNPSGWGETAPTP